MLSASCVAEEDPGQVEVFVAGENVVCGAGDACGGDGIGQASLDIEPADGSLCYDVELENLPRPTAAHIHRGPLGEAGPVVLDLEWGDERGGSKCLEGLEPALLRGIVEDKRGHYLQVHSEGYPEGAARGHLAT